MSAVSDLDDPDESSTQRLWREKPRRPYIMLPLSTRGQQQATKKLTILFICYHGRFLVSSLVRYLFL